MKKTAKLFASLLLIGLLPWMGCTNTEDGKYVEPITLYEKIKGEWVLTNLSYVDETANALGISPKEITLSDQFGFETFALELNVDDNNRPTTYQVSGTAPRLFPADGYWDLNSPFPTTTGASPVINLYADATKTTLTGRLSVVTTPGSSAEMNLKLTRYTGKVAYVSYQYKLIKNQ